MSVFSATLVRQTGTTPRKRAQFNEAMEWNPDMIVAFPRERGFDSCLKIGRSAVGALDPRVLPVELMDPTSSNPWNEKELLEFKKHVQLAAAALVAHKKVMFVCVGGKKRSRAALLCALKLSGQSLEGFEEPEDECLREVVRNIECIETLSKLAPMGSKNLKRRRT